MAQSRSVRTSRSSRRSFAAFLDSLESRTLLSGITNYNLPNLAAGGFPAAFGTAVDGQGNLWVANAAGPQLEKITKNPDNSITDTAVPIPFNMLPESLVYSPVNNSLYVGDGFSGEIFQVDTSGNTLNDYLVPPISADGEGIQAMTVAPDGAIWFASTGIINPDSTYTVQVGRIATDGSLTMSTLPTTGSGATAISAAPDGSIWVAATEEAGTATPTSSLVKLSFDGTSISSQNFTIPQGNQVVTNAVAASDGSVWYAIQSDPIDNVPVPDQIDHAVVVNGQLSVTEYDIPELAGESGIAAVSLQFDSSGTLWFAERSLPGAGGTSGISSLDPATGDFTRSKFDDPNLSPYSLSVSSTDVWATLTSADGFTPVNYQIADLDLTASSGAIAATDPGIAATTNQPFSGPIAQFVSSDAGDFSYTINYGNGQTASGTLPNDPSGLYTIVGNTTYTAAGNFPLSITIASATGDVSSVNGEAVVTSVTPLIAQGVPAISGQKDIALAPNFVGQSTLVVAQFTGAPASYAATINWGDNTSTTGTIVSLGNNQYAVELAAGTTKTFGAIGSFNINVSITDGTQTVTAATLANISAVPVVASQNLILKPILGPIFLGTVATFTADPLATANWFKATIHWGDNSTSTGLIVRTSAGHFQIIGLHIYRKGTYNLSTLIVDSVDAETATATATIKI
ncbi:MAG TPA: hypothetical protein VM008_00960 [Phycisphaerae bacterium]|nr:hypothetical protein [Phycisphaerae bacterium]